MFYTDYAKVVGILASGEGDLVESSLLREPVILLVPDSRWSSTFRNTVMEQVPDEGWRAFAERKMSLIHIRVNA